MLLPKEVIELIGNILFAKNIKSKEIKTRQKNEVILRKTLRKNINLLINVLHLNGNL